MKSICYGTKVGSSQRFERGKSTLSGERIEEVIEKENNKVVKVTIGVFSQSNVMLYKSTKYPTPSDREVHFSSGSTTYVVFLDDYLDIHDDDYIEGEIIDGETVTAQVDRSDIVPRKKVIYVLSFTPIDDHSAILVKFVTKYNFIKQNSDAGYVLMSSDTNLISAAERDGINLSLATRMFRDVYINYPGKCPSCGTIDSDTGYGDICGCGTSAFVPCPLCEDNDIVIPGLCNDCRFLRGA